MTEQVLEALLKTLDERKSADPEQSYVAKLYQKGARKIAKKLGEEATELVIDSIRLEENPKKPKRRENLKNEAADLLFHYLVLLEYHDVDFKDILDILQDRIGTSGLTEKANRTKK